MQDVSGWWRLAALIGPLVSGLVAAFVVHLLTQSRERERWLADRKMQEFRELLSGISDAYSALLIMQPHVPLDDNDQMRLIEAKANSVRIIRDRIFVAKDIEPGETSNRWLFAMHRYEKTLNAQDFHDEYGAIRDEIIQKAIRCAPRSTVQRLMFWKD